MLRISLDGLQVLDAIDRRGSFAGAASELHRVASTISYTVAKLEEGLGVALFERAGPKATLTPAGRELLDEGRHLLRAAIDLEQRVRRVSTGWETELTLCLESLFPPAVLAADLCDFYRASDGTRIRICSEALSGTWEALLDRRADLAIGAAGDGPSGGGYRVEPLGTVPFVFAVAPTHPLAALSRPLRRDDLLAHRAVAVADSALRLLPRTVGLLFGQNTVTVPDIAAKLAFQVAGHGFGYLPERLARAAIAAGRLVVKATAEERGDERLYLAWRSDDDGAALRWWIDRLRRPGRLAALLDAAAEMTMPI